MKLVNVDVVQDELNPMLVLFVDNLRVWREFGVMPTNATLKVSCSPGTMEGVK